MNPSNYLLKVLTFALCLVINSMAGNTIAFAEGIAGTVSGSQSFALIACKYKNIKKTPQKMNYFDGLMGSAYPGMDHYWQEVSYGNIDLTGSANFGWYTLPGRDSDYLSKDPLIADCLAQADADVYFPDYEGIIVALNGPVPTSTTGWPTTLYLDGVVKRYALNFLADTAWQSARVTAHEMGHSFGLWHSSGLYGNVYDSQWDVMSTGGSNMGTEFDPIPHHTITDYKDRLGWIPPSQKFIAPANRTETITLERTALPTDGGTAYLMAEIEAGVINRYTLEARRLAGYDNTPNLPGEGIVIHKIEGNQAWVIDDDLNGTVSDEGSYFVPGETFSDPANDVTVTVDSDTGTGYVVTITRGPAINLPDLVLTDVSGPGQAAPGSSVNLSITVVNQGNESTVNEFPIALYLSDDNTITANDMILMEWFMVPPLAAGASYSTSASVGLPDGPGNFYFGAIVDADNQINEENNNNNTLLGNAVAVGSFPPVVTTDPATGIAGSEATLNGTVNPSGLATSAWYEWGETTSYGNTEPVHVLANNYNDVPISDTITNLKASTTYHYRVVAQNAGGTTYGNDQSFVSGVVDTDLTMTAISGPAQAVVGTYISNVSTTTYNQGTVGTGAFHVTVFIADDPQLTGWKDVVDSDRLWDGLAGGASGTINYQFPLIPGSTQPGTYYLVGWADEREIITETDETNNTLSAGQIEIIASDLQMTDVNGPSSAEQNSQITVNNTTCNQGAGRTPDVPSSFNVGLYLSTDATITTADTLLTTRSVGILQPSECDSAATLVDITPAIAAGNYYIGAMADSGSVVTESDENNNATAGNQITITTSALPDFVIDSIEGPKSARGGRTITITATITNQGGVTATSTQGYFLSTDTVIDKDLDIFLGSAGTTFAAGETRILSYDFVVPGNISGDYYVGGLADWVDFVAESDETNNATASVDTTRIR